jgi:hypothetical protein
MSKQEAEIAKRETLLGRLISLLFWIFFVATIAYIVLAIIVPSPSDWEAVTKQIGGFPQNLTWTVFGEALLRHLALWANIISTTFLINTLNFTFLTIFVHHISKNYKNLDYCNGKIRMSVYVEWSMVILISGILYISALVTGSDIINIVTRLSTIVVFALILYFILYKLRNKLKIDEDAEEAKTKGKDDNSSSRSVSS